MTFFTSFECGLINKSRAALILFVICFSMNEVKAKAPADEVGEWLGCQEQPDASPYCTDPDIRRLVINQYPILDQWETMRSDAATSAEVAKVNVAAALMGAAQNQLKLDVRRCASDVECIESAVSESTAAMYKATGLTPRAEPLSEVEIAEFAAGEQLRAEENEVSKAALRELDIAYDTEWRAAQQMLNENSLPMFNFKFQSPDRWRKSWSRICQRGDNCLDAKAQSLDVMISWRDEKVTAAQAHRKEVADRERREKNAAKAAAAEGKRRKASTQAKIEAAEAQARRVFRSNSLIRRVLLGEFKAADEIAVRLVDDYFSKNYSGFSALVGEGTIDSLRSAAIANRRNLIVTAYGRTRFEVLGNCGEPYERISVQLTEDKVFKNIYGVVVRTIPGKVVRYNLPTRFARYAGASDFEASSSYFESDVFAITDCESYLRTHLENQMLEYAAWKP